VGRATLSRSLSDAQYVGHVQNRPVSTPGEHRSARVVVPVLPLARNAALELTAIAALASD
jgi:hypothetical protein